MDDNQKNKTYLLVSVLCLAFFVLWQGIIAPSLTAIPDDFSYEAELVSTDNFYDSDLNKYLGEGRSVGTFRYSAKPSGQNDKILEIKNNFDVSTLAGLDVVSIEHFYGVDKKTGKHVAGYGDKDRQGYLFAPRNLKPGEDFIYWHISYDGPARMHFNRETKIFGLKVFEYEADYGLVAIDQTNNLLHLPDVGVTKGIEVEPTLRLWVEPTTGYLIKYEDESVAYYYDLDTREKIAPWNKFKNEYTESSIVEHVSEAAKEKQMFIIFHMVAPALVITLALLFILLFLFKKKNSDIGHTHGRLPRNQKILFILFLVLFSLAVFIFLNRFFKNANEEYAKAEFESRISEINENILEQFNTRTNVLRGARGLFDASDEVTADEWKKYVGGLDILNNFIGISSLRFAEYVDDAEKEDHESKMKETMGPEYRIWPEGEKEHYAPVIFYEPRTPGGDRIFGFDLLSDKERREAAIRARDTGEIAISERAPQIFPDDLEISARILIYLPVYNKSLPVGSVEERRLATAGFVYSSFRMQGFMESIFGIRNGIINIEIFDTSDKNNLSEESLLYINHTDFKYGVSYDSQFSRLAELNVGGRTWIIRYSSTPEFGLDFSQRFFPPLFIVAAGILYALVLILVYELFVMRSRALELVREEKEKIISLENKIR